MIFKYVFDDGTILKLLDDGLSEAEVWKLSELHGHCDVGVEYVCVSAPYKRYC